jgi:hypothetical protein
MKITIRGEVMLHLISKFPFSGTLIGHKNKNGDLYSIAFRWSHFHLAFNCPIFACTAPSPSTLLSVTPPCGALGVHEVVPPVAGVEQEEHEREGEAAAHIYADRCLCLPTEGGGCSAVQCSAVQCSAVHARARSHMGTRADV